MWLTEFLATSATPDAGMIAPVSFAEGQNFGAAGDCENRGMPLFGSGPCGYLPRDSDRLLILRCDGTDLCAGVACNTDGLLPGELRLGSPDGAYIHLCQNGEVVINGLRISPQGQILPTANS